MKNNVWAKTILYVYKYLDNLADAIDRIVEKEAMHSFYYLTNSNIDNSVMSVSNRIIALIERKAKLINMKVLTEEVLENCRELNAQLLIERYIDNDRSEDIAIRHDMPIRTYFRKLIQAEDNFSSLMADRGYDEKRLHEYLKEEKWIKDVYNGFLTKRFGEESLLEELKRAI